MKHNEPAYVVNQAGLQHMLRFVNSYLLLMSVGDKGGWARVRVRMVAE